MPTPDQSTQGTLADWATMVEEILSPRERMAEPGGPMKTTLFFNLARLSGSLGFSEAWPLNDVSTNFFEKSGSGKPSGPYGMDAHSFRNVHDQWNVRVVLELVGGRRLGHGT